MTTWRKILIGSIGSLAILFAGCAESTTSTTTRDDVQSAREEFEQQADEAREAMNEADKNVRAEVREAEAAREKLEQAEGEFASERAREEYIERQTSRLEEFETRADELEARADRFEGDNRDALDDIVAQVRESCDTARERLDELEAADVADWTVKRDDVEMAMNQAAAHIDEAERIR